MKKYSITVTNGSGWRKEFESTSRNAKKHLRDNYGAQGGARVAVVEYEHEEGGYLIWEDYKTMPI